MQGGTVQVFGLGKQGIIGDLGETTVTGFQEGKPGCRWWRTEQETGMEIAFLGKLGCERYQRQGGQGQRRPFLCF